MLFTSFWLTKILLKDRSHVLSNSNKAHYWITHQRGDLFEQTVLDEQLYCLVYTPDKSNAISLQETRISGQDDHTTIAYELQTWVHGVWLQAASYKPKENRMVTLKMKPTITIVTCGNSGNYMIGANITASGTCNKGTLRCRQRADSKGINNNKKYSL